MCLNIQLFGQTVYYCQSVFERGEEPPQFHAVAHFQYISHISLLHLKLDFNISTSIQFNLILYII